MKNERLVNCEKVGFQFCSEWVEQKSGITQVCRERVSHSRRGVVEPSWTQCLQLFLFVGRTTVGPTSKMSACWHDRRKLKPECTDRIGSRELDHVDNHFVDKEADLVVHPVFHIQPVQLPRHDFRHWWSIRQLQYQPGGRAENCL